jgi:protein TonB
MPSSRARAVTSTSRRNIAIASGVVVFHVAALWALQTGLIRRAVEVIVPVEVLAEIIAPPAPKVEPPPPAPKPPEPIKREPQPVKKPLPPAPQPVAIATPAPPAPNAPTGVVEPQPPAPPVAAPVAPAPPAPAKVELPSSDADYLNNPLPPYPPMSRRQGESGTVRVQVRISAQGVVLGEPVVAQSSGYERLDRAAVDAVRKWRFVPGKRNGVPVEMTHVVPVIFKLDS